MAFASGDNIASCVAVFCPNNGSAEFKITTLPTGGEYCDFWYRQDDGDLYVFSTEDDRSVLYRSDGWSFTEISADFARPTTATVIRVEWDGPNHRIYYDDVLIGSAVDATYPGTATDRTAFNVTGATPRVDDFSLSTLTADFVGTEYAEDSSFTASELEVFAPSGTQVGDLVVLHFIQALLSTTVPDALTLSNADRIASEPLAIVSGAYRARQSVYSRIVTSDDLTNGWTFVNDNNTPAMSVRVTAYRGVPDDALIDYAYVTNAGATAINLASVPVPATNTLGIGFVYADGNGAGTTFTSGVMTERHDVGSAAVYDFNQAAAGATGTKAITAAASGAYGGFLVVFKTRYSAQQPVPAAAGTAVSGTGNITVAWPAHEPGDIGILLVESTGGQAAVLGTPNGFTAIDVANTGSGTAGTRLTAFWCRATSGSMASPVVTDPGDHAVGQIYTFRGCVATGDPIAAYATATKASASTSASAPGLTTPVDNCLVVTAISRDNDSSSTTAFSAWANSDLTLVGEIGEAGTTSGNGGGFGVAAGVKGIAGTVGTTTATVTSSINASITIALKPDGGASVESADGLSSGTGSAAAVGASTASASGASASSANAVAVGKSIAAVTASTAGASTAVATSKSIAAAVAVAYAVASASSVGKSTAASVGVATGATIVGGDGEGVTPIGPNEGVAESFGTSSASAVGKSIAAAVAVSAGVGAGSGAGDSDQPPAPPPPPALEFFGAPTGHRVAVRIDGKLYVGTYADIAEIVSSQAVTDVGDEQVKSKSIARRYARKDARALRGRVEIEEPMVVPGFDPATVAERMFRDLRELYSAVFAEQLVLNVERAMALKRSADNQAAMNAAELLLLG